MEVCQGVGGAPCPFKALHHTCQLCQPWPSPAEPTMLSLTASVRGTPLRVQPPSTRRGQRVAARAEQLCGLTADEAAARLAKAPPSVQAFIKRWGHREVGCNAAAALRIRAGRAGGKGAARQQGWARLRPGPPSAPGAAAHAS